ncbi:MAG: alpha/beta hydrolase [Alphaproteobacteria bacterium]|nr:alpha/beta hydrolase [Alphaproteobacteria bacterium]
MKLKHIFTGIILSFLTAVSTKTVMANEKTWDKVFPKSDLVNVQKVTFKNRFGIDLVGDLYMPKNGVHPGMAAIAVTGPFGAVKEQASGLYALNLAERGFITLAFDPSFTGESGGNVRNVASPDINTDDISAAVDYLITRPEVDENKIGVIGICGFGGFALNAAAQDTRIKATVTSTMYDMTRVSAKGYNDSMSEEDLYQLRKTLNQQRTADTKARKNAPAEGLPATLTGDEPQFVQDYYEYYKTPIGFHERSINSNGAWNKTSALSLITQPILSYAHTIKSPVLMIHGEKAHSRYFSEDAFKKLTGDNKELMIIPGANHVDLYYKTDVIPFNRIADFFKENLNDYQYDFGISPNK